MQYSQPPPYTEKTPYPQAQPPPASAPAPVYAAPMYAPPVVGSYPVQCVCPHCRQQVVTQTVKKNGLLAWLLCGGMTLVGLWLCCFIPFCVDACKDTEHYCPSCRTLLGLHKTL